MTDRLFWDGWMEGGAVGVPWWCVSGAYRDSFL